jgi:hypothetical protein
MEEIVNNERLIQNEILHSAYKDYLLASKHRNKEDALIRILMEMSLGLVDMA